MLNEVIQYIDDKYPYWLTSILNSGKPRIDTNTPTTNIQQTNNGIEVIINPDYAQQASIEDLAFMLSHEVMHIVRGDIHTYQTETYTDKERLSKALDLLVNDTLIGNGFTKPGHAISGPETLGIDTSGLTVREVYDLLEQEENEEEDQQDGDGDNGGEGGSEGGDDQQEGDASGNSGGDGSGNNPIAGSGQDHTTWNQLDQQEAPPSEAEQSGGEGPTESTKYDRLEGRMQAQHLPLLDLDAIFRIVEPELAPGLGLGNPPRNTWAIPRRNIRHLWPTITLPSSTDNRHKLDLSNKKMQIVVCLDNSGSVSSEDVALFRLIAANLPRNKAHYIYVCAASYGVQVNKKDLLDQDLRLPNTNPGASISNARRIANGDIPWDAHSISIGKDAIDAARVLVEPGFVQGYSSAEFDAMNAWIIAAIKRGDLREYPKSVMVISDGQSSLTSATKEQAERWHVFTNNNTDRGRRTGCMIPAENFVEINGFVMKESAVPKKQRV